MDHSGFPSLFASRDIRCTRQREQIYAALCATKSHPTAEELFQAVRTNAPGISLATIYNTLEVFTRSGLCRRMATAHATGGGGAFRYDADITEHAHVVHADGAVRDLPEDLSRSVLEHIPAEIVESIQQRMGVRGRLSVEFIAEADNSPTSLTAPSAPL